ncbi:MAG: cupin domain-containing protein [Thermococcus sp.]|nr:cupin domain-containing protein [Thermococcus sp.]
MPCEVYPLDRLWKMSLNKASEIFKNESIQIGILTLAPKTRLPEAGFSIHEEFHEFAYIVEGEVTFVSESKKIHLKKGDFMYNEPGTPHYTENISDTPAKILWFLVPK